MKMTWQNMLGAACAASFIVLVAGVLPGFFTGDFSMIKAYFEAYPGSQPFMIMMTPVVVIAGPAYIWRFYRDWRQRG